MYYIIGAAFCIGFVVGMAFGIVRGKKELANKLLQTISDTKSLTIDDFINNLNDLSISIGDDTNDQFK